jgi:hypothetical protein
LSSTHTSLEGDQFKGAVCTLVVELRLPVVAVVELLVTCRVLRVWCGRRGHGLLECSAPNNGVNMGRNDSRANDRIAALDCQWLAVDREELAMGEADQGQAEHRKQGRVEGRHDTRGD